MSRKKTPRNPYTPLAKRRKAGTMTTKKEEPPTEFFIDPEELAEVKRAEAEQLQRLRQAIDQETQDQQELFMHELEQDREAWIYSRDDEYERNNNMSDNTTIPAFDNCPRCNSRWKTNDELDTSRRSDNDSYTECSNSDCNMRFDRLMHQLVAPHFLGVKGYHLGWNLESKECVYASINDIMLDKEVKLPWMPFTVSTQELEEQLAKQV